MKALKIAFLILVISTVTFGQIGITLDGSGNPFNKSTESWSTWQAKAKFKIEDQISIWGTVRSSRNRDVTTKPERSPSHGGLLGISYRVNPYLGIAFGGGLQTRHNQNSKEMGWLVGGECFLGLVDQENFYLRKQVFVYCRIEKGQFDKDFYMNAKALLPLGVFAVGGKYESDLGFGPHAELKIRISDEESMKSINIYGSYFMEGDIKTGVVGVRIEVN